MSKEDFKLLKKLAKKDDSFTEILDIYEEVGYLEEVEYEEFKEKKLSQNE